ncbi:hypothetical protein ACFL2V_12705 [Pseudomonadota bacterium]
MIKIGDIDIGKVLLELQFQSKLNSFLIEKLLNDQKVTQQEIEKLKSEAAKAVNEYYDGKEMITYQLKKEEK